MTVALSLQVSELKEDNMPTLTQKTNEIVPVQQENTRKEPIILKTNSVESDSDFPPNNFPISEVGSLIVYKIRALNTLFPLARASGECTQPTTRHGYIYNTGEY